MTSAINAAIEQLDREDKHQLRRDRRHDETNLDDILHEHAAAEEISMARYLSTFHSDLTNDEIVAFCLRHEYSLTYREIGERMGFSYETARRKVVGATEKLSATM